MLRVEISNEDGIVRAIDVNSNEMLLETINSISRRWFAEQEKALTDAIKAELENDDDFKEDIVSDALRDCGAYTRDLQELVDEHQSMSEALSNIYYTARDYV